MLPVAKLQAQSASAAAVEQDVLRRLIARAHILLEKSQADSCLHLLERAENMAATVHDPVVLADFHMLYGDYYQYRQQHDTAQVWYQIALAQNGLSAARRLPLLHRLANSCKSSFSYEKSMQYCTACVELADSLDDPSYQVRCLQLLGTVTSVFPKEIKKVPSYRRRALDICLATNAKTELANAYYCLGEAHFNMGSRLLAERYIDSALYWLQQFPDGKLQTQILFEKGRLQFSRGNYPQALDYYRNVLKDFERRQDTLQIIQVTLNMGTVYLRMNDESNALALADSISSLVIAKNAPEAWKDLYNLYYEAFKQKGDYLNALQFFERYEQVKDSITALTNVNGMADIEAQYLLKDKQRHIENQTAKLNWQRTMLRTYLSGFLLTGLLLGFLLYLYQRIRKTRRELVQQKNIVEVQNRELQHLDELKSRFFANVSHELRTPLTLMIGPIRAVLKRSNLDKKDQDALHLAQQNGQGLLRLVNEILDLSKLESGKMELHAEAVDFYAYIRRIVGFFEQHAQGLDVRFQLHYQARKNLHLEIDAQKVQTVLSNLLSNALKYTQRGGSISVVVEDMGTHINIKVVDTGRGIHASDLPFVFDRFYQSRQPNLAIEGGTGIGLALSSELVGLMQGRLWAESSLGKGSTFFFEFPKKEILSAVADAPKAKSQTDDWTNLEERTFPAAQITVIQPESSRPTLLIVEDNADLRQYLKMVLNEKYNIVEVENGHAALQFLQSAGPRAQAPADLIISDVMMPIMDGFQLLEKLKSDDLWRHIPVIMLTARAELVDKLRALRVGVDDYLVKPFIEEELLARVENLIQRAQARANWQQALPESAVPAPSAEPMEPAPNHPEHNVRVSQDELRWLEELELHVHKRLHEFDLHAEDLADNMATSRSHFFRQVKRLTGLTPAQYIDEARFQQARLLLESGRGSSVKAVAYAVGFRQVKHFSQSYKQRYGKSPSEYLA